MSLGTDNDVCAIPDKMCQKHLNSSRVQIKSGINKTNYYSFTSCHAVAHCITLTQIIFIPNYSDYLREPLCNFLSLSPCFVDFAINFSALYAGTITDKSISSNFFIIN